MKNVLVTGATGFVGTHLIQQLIAHSGITIKALVRDPNSYSHPCDSVTPIAGDIQNPQSLIGVCDGVDTVFHLAGYAHASSDLTAAAKHHQINFIGTQHIFREAKRAGVKSFIYISSVKAQDAAEKKDKSPYAIAKLAAENYLLAEVNNSAASKSATMHIVILRPALVYGCGWKGNLAMMLQAIAKNRFPPIPESHNVRSLISVDDLCRAAILACNAPKAHGKVYTVADNEQYSTRKIYDLMHAALGKTHKNHAIPLFVFRTLAWCGETITFLTGKRMPFNNEVFAKLFESAYYHSSAIKKELGFNPQEKLASVLPTIVADYQIQNKS